MSPRDHGGRGQICRRSSSQQSRTRTKRSSYIPLEGLPTVLTLARAGHRPRKLGKLNSHWGIQSPRTHKQIYTYKVYRHIQKPATSCPSGGGGRRGDESVKLCQNVTRTAARIYWQAFIRRGVGTQSRWRRRAGWGRLQKGGLNHNNAEDDDENLRRTEYEGRRTEGAEVVGGEEIKRAYMYK